MEQPDTNPHTTRNWKHYKAASALIILVVIMLLFGWQLLTPTTTQVATRPQSAASTKTGTTPARGPTATPTLIPLEGNYPQLGKQTPDFTLSVLANYNAPKLHLASLRGTPVVLNFWASWCGPCKEETPLLQKTWSNRTGKQKKVLFIGIQVADPPERGKAFIEQEGVTYPVVTVDRENTPIDYQVGGLPSTIFLDSQGRAVRAEPGALTETILQNDLNAIAQ